MAGMNGLSQDPVRSIQSNLRQYKYRDGFPILKELIQNASDAGASKLLLFYYKGFKDAVNPLFAKEGVLIYNDGPFSDRDAEKIAALGGDGKWQDAESIGKYGLGLKSVYHLCDAFIYYNHSKPQEPLDALCPFFGSKSQAKYEALKWNDLDSDKQKLLDFIEEKIGKVSRGLSIFVPIEVDEYSPIVEKKRDIFTKHPFNKSDSNDLHLIQNLITTFAILSQTAQKKSLRYFFYQMENKSLELKVKDGCIEIVAEKEGQKQEYKSEYTIYPIDNWTNVEKNCNFIEKLNDSIPEENRDKILKDNKIVLELLKTPKLTERAKLRLIFAAYLPLPSQEGVKDDIPLNGDYDYGIIIHAPFAVDSGRSDIEDFTELCEQFEDDKISRHVYAYWNRFLFQEIIAPNIVNLLKDSIESVVDESDRFDVLYELQKVLESSPKNSASFLFRDFGLIYEYNVPNYKWNLVNTQNSNIVYIPQTEISIIDNILKDFKVPANTHLLLYEKNTSGKGHFIPNNLLLDSEVVLKLLEQLVETVDDKKELSFLETFLKCNRIDGNAYFDRRTNLQKGYCGLLKRLGYFFVKENLEVIKSITKLFSTLFTIEFYELNNAIEELDQNETWEKLWSDNCPYIIIPTTGDVTRRIAQRSVENWISFVSHQHFSGFLNEYLVTHLVDDFNAALEIIEERYSDLPFFESRIVGSDDTEYLSFNDFGTEPVFRNFDGADNIVIQFSKLLNRKVYKVLKTEDSRVRAADKEGVIKCLEKYYKTWSDETFVESEKAHFLNNFFDYDYTTRRVERERAPLYLFLLSDFKHTNGSNQIVFFAKDCDVVLREIYKKCLANLEKTTFLDLQGFRYDFFETNKQIFGESIVTEEKCLIALSKCQDLSFLKSEYFLKNRVVIFKKIWEYEKEPQGENSLFLRVPLHKLSNGEYGPFQRGMLFNRNNIEIPLEELPVFIVCEDDDNLKLYQDRVFTTDNDRVLTISKALRYLFDNVHDVVHCQDWIFAQLKANQKVAEADWNVVFSTAWIPVSLGKCCALKDIILDDFCSFRCSNILKNALAMYSLVDVQTSKECQSVIKNFILNNYKNKDGLGRFIDIIVEKIETQNLDYIKFNNDEKRIWDCALELNGFPIFDIFNALKIDRKIDENELWRRYQSVELESQVEKNLGIQLLNQLVEKEYSAIRRILFCKVFVLVYVEGFDFNLIVRYPTKKEKWEKPNQISIDSKGDDVDDCYKICEELENHIPRFDGDSKRIAGEQFQDAKTVLDIIHTNWRNSCKSKGYIDVILYLLQGEYRNQSRWQPNVQNALKNLFDRANGLNRNSTNIKYSIDAYEVKDRFDPKFDFPKIVFFANETDKVKTISLLGNNIELFKSNPSVFKSERNCYDVQSQRYSYEIYRLPDNAYNNEESVDESLEKFIKRLLFDVYRIKSDEIFGELFGHLKIQITKVTQVSIGAAENRIFSGLFDSLAGLKNEKIRELNNRYNELFERSEGFQQQSYESQNKLLDELRDFVKSDEEVQNEIFDRVQRTVKQNQYSVLSIIFELFQNADDCVNDFEINDLEIASEQRRFIVNDNGQSIEIRHFGRKINEMFANENDNKYKWDLLNMLKLSHSEKGDGDSGKFGLGFKSVYTLCKRPIIRSGDLQFEIVAGLYPRYIKVENEYRDCTCIELPYENKEDAAKCINRFKEESCLLTIFSKQINRIEINGEIYTCKRENLGFFGKVILQKIELDNLMLLMIKPMDGAYQLLFKLNETGDIEILDSPICKVWNLSPLEYAKTLPFIINAKFEVDTGRLNLAGNNVNEEPLRKIAESLIEILTELNESKSDYVDGIMAVMLDTYASQSELFRNFAQIVLDGVYDKLGKITDGRGNCIKLEDLNLFAMDISNLTDNPSVFLALLNKYMGVVLTHIAGNAYSDILEKYDCVIHNISINDVFKKIVQNDEIDYQDLDNIYEMHNVLTPYVQRSFWQRIKDIELYKLRNRLDEFKPICTLHLISDNSEEAVNEKYFDKPELRNFLCDIDVFKEHIQQKVVAPMSSELPTSEFPQHPVRDWEKLLEHVHKDIDQAKDVKYEEKTNLVRVTKEDDNNRAYLSNMYGNEYDVSDKRKTCQLCHKFTDFSECVEVKLKPQKELSPLFLNLCPNCSARYDLFRRDGNSCKSILDSIRQKTQEEVTASVEHVDVPLDDQNVLWFTQTHFAQLQEILKIVEND